MRMKNIILCICLLSLPSFAEGIKPGNYKNYSLTELRERVGKLEEAVKYLLEKDQFSNTNSVDSNQATSKEKKKPVFPFNKNDYQFTCYIRSFGHKYKGSAVLEEEAKKIALEKCSKGSKAEDCPSEKLVCGPY